ncbi:acyl-CoA synthetase [Nocardia huaxiensis]|uniref:Long-chain fatty acid--CoA ligase n=1 Tax=Nocardia huaxiensis TaxID=2755382 RepID=A0A7D6ZIH7_9NOCA|nr:long-chain fatty acid--CoA ligase [Nocardia huaxiensis]QLY30580.1 long-chain fatty acid--CoA ligase [Nocardia huaxiensis]UFS95817.1 long-chain fatty acid--CoA ligase [Nocardia huaxiensis]
MYLTQGLHRAVQQSPDRVAVIHGTRSRTFTELHDRVARFAGALRELGVREGDRVAIASLNSDRYHEYFFAVPWADAVLNPINIRWSPAEIAYSLEDSGTGVLLVDDAFAQAVPAIEQHYSGLRHVVFIGDGARPEGMLDYEELIAASTPVEDAHRGGYALAGLFYTGGTTGFPKGVMLTHNNLLTSALGAMSTGVLHTPGGRVLHAAPMFHLADYALWNAASLAGNTHVTVPMFEPKAVLAAIEQHGVTDTLLVPTMIQMLVDSPALAEHDTSGLRKMLYGGSPIAAAVLERAMKAFPNVRFTQAYGMTEVAPVATLLLPEDHILEGPGSERLTSGGRAAPHAEVRIVDESGREVPRGTVGEIIVRGAHVTPGYWNKPAETEAAVRDGWMHTGDGGRMDADGYVYVVDRIKDMIVTGGENVYSTEVENAIAKHPGVAAVAVIGLPDEQWGERVHAVVVPMPGSSPTAEEIRAHTKELIAGYKAPRTVDFAESLPISGAGKILKRDLRALYTSK